MTVELVQRFVRKPCAQETYSFNNSIRTKEKSEMVEDAMSEYC